MPAPLAVVYVGVGAGGRPDRHECVAFLFVVDDGVCEVGRRWGKVGSVLEEDVGAWSTAAGVCGISACMHVVEECSTLPPTSPPPTPPLAPPPGEARRTLGLLCFLLFEFLSFAEFRNAHVSGGKCLFTMETRALKTSTSPATYKPPEVLYISLVALKRGNFKIF